MTPIYRASVIMINRNGGAALTEALNSCRADLEACWRDDPCFEFILVDNGSTDDSLVDAGSALHGAPFPWRCINEPQAGVNYARNAGVRAAQGDLLIFTDSDLKFRGGWLAAYLAAARQHPDVHVFAGRIRVGDRPAALPDWVDLDGPYRRTAIVVQADYGSEPCVLPITNSAGPAGPSMAYRRSIFDRYGEFNTQFGLRPGSLVAGAESEFCNRLALAGERFAYVPDSVVDHPIRASQLSRRYFLNRLHGTGRVHARMQRLRGTRERRVFGVTTWVVRQLIVDTLAYAATALTCRDAKRRFYRRGQLSILFGYLHEDFLDWYWTLAGNDRRTRAGLPGDRTDQPLTDESAVRFYDQRYANGYMRDWPDWQKRRIVKLVRELNLPPTGRALDFGCGQGVFTDVLRAALPGWTICGTDLSGSAIEAARSRFPGCSFFPLLPDDQGQSAQPFDLLFTHHVLEHVINIDRTWKVMADLVKPGGVMLHVLPCGDDNTLERRICQLRFDGVDRRRGNRFFYEDEGHVRRMQSAEMNAVAERHGLQPGARRFANAYWGAIDWITEAGPEWVSSLTDGACARDAAARTTLRRLRLGLLLVSVARLPAIRLAGAAQAPLSSRNSVKLLLAVAGYPLAWAVNRFLKTLSHREWQSA
ncbi:MAG TPA: methyltransferase domain-containing protein, partial [Vicinamibacterales bacterium]